MSARPFVIAPGSYPRPLNVVGEHITVLASGEATGSYEIFLQEGPEGSGPPPHSHPWDESFYVVKGELEFGVGSETLSAPAGTLVHLPAGTMHWFRFGKGGGQMVSMTSRLGASRMFGEYVPRDRARISILHHAFSPRFERHGDLVRLADRAGGDGPTARIAVPHRGPRILLRYQLDVGWESRPDRHNSGTVWPLAVDSPVVTS